MGETVPNNDAKYNSMDKEKYYEESIKDNEISQDNETSQNNEIVNNMQVNKMISSQEFQELLSQNPKFAKILINIRESLEVRLTAEKYPNINNGHKNAIALAIMFAFSSSIINPVDGAGTIIKNSISNAIGKFKDSLGNLGKDKDGKEVTLNSPKGIKSLILKIFKNEDSSDKVKESADSFLKNIEDIVISQVKPILEDTNKEKKQKKLALRVLLSPTELEKIINGDTQYSALNISNISDDKKYLSEDRKNRIILVEESINNKAETANKLYKGIKEMPGGTEALSFVKDWFNGLEEGSFKKILKLFLGLFGLNEFLDGTDSAEKGKQSIETLNDILNNKDNKNHKDINSNLPEGLKGENFTEEELSKLIENKKVGEYGINITSKSSWTGLLTGRGLNGKPLEKDNILYLLHSNLKSRGGLESKQGLISILDNNDNLQQLYTKAVEDRNTLKNRKIEKPKGVGNINKSEISNFLNEQKYITVNSKLDDDTAVIGTSIGKIASKKLTTESNAVIIKEGNKGGVTKKVIKGTEGINSDISNSSLPEKLKPQAKILKEQFDEINKIPEGKKKLDKLNITTLNLLFQNLDTLNALFKKYVYSSEKYLISQDEYIGDKITEKMSEGEVFNLSNPLVIENIAVPNEYLLKPKDKVKKIEFKFNNGEIIIIKTFSDKTTKQFKLKTKRVTKSNGMFSDISKLADGPVNLISFSKKGEEIVFTGSVINNLGNNRSQMKSILDSFKSLRLLKAGQSTPVKDKNGEQSDYETTIELISEKTEKK